jgi:hypothetical protein
MRTFTVDGRERAFLFGLSAITPLLEIYFGEGATEQSLTLGTVKKAPEVAYLAFLAGAKANKEPVDFTQDDVSVWLDQDFGIFQAINDEIVKFMAGIGEKKN